MIFSSSGSRTCGADSFREPKVIKERKTSVNSKAQPWKGANDYTTSLHVRLRIKNPARQTRRGHLSLPPLLSTECSHFHARSCTEERTHQPVCNLLNFIFCIWIVGLLNTNIFNSGAVKSSDPIALYTQSNFKSLYYHRNFRKTYKTIYNTYTKCL
jgi:hypothetical protein